MSLKVIALLEILLSATALQNQHKRLPKEIRCSCYQIGIDFGRIKLGNI